MLELWRMRCTSSLPSLPGPLWLGVVAAGRVLSMGQIELNSLFMLNWIVWIAWNRNFLTIKLCTYEIELFICIKIDLALNNLQTLPNSAHLRRVETSIEKIRKRTSCYMPISNWSYKAYSLFHFETGTTTTVFNLPDNLHD